jgi:valyl-tRNA synthetase
VPELTRILSTPIRLPGEMRISQLAALVSMDAICRRARSLGEVAEWVAFTLAGDLAGQHETERELAREGSDRATLGREAFVERVKEHEVAARGQLAETIALLGVDADLDAGAIDGEASARAAATAFVRLFEQGRLQQAERVVDTCARCETVVDPVDGEVGLLEVECPVVDVALDGPPGVLRLVLEAPELLPGVVAMLVPDGDGAAGRLAVVPLAGRTVPVVADAGVEEPVALVPAHDRDALQRARAFGLAPLEVLDAEGIVRVEGPLQGLPRYAARAAATKLLEDEGAVVGSVTRTETVTRCRRCGSVLVPRLGLHWFLAIDDLERAAADAVRDLPVTFSTPAARDELVDRAGAGGEWCLSHQVWAGQPVPVARCLDCGKVAVAVDGASSCGKCMGLLAPDDSVLDARFVGAVAMLSAAGWPDDERTVVDLAPATTLVVPPTGVARWALPVAALGVRLAGTAGFGHVAQLESPVGDVSAAEIAALVEAEGTAVARLALLAGGLDAEEARQLAARIEAPPHGDSSIDDLERAFDAAFDAGLPAMAMRVLASVLAAGIPRADSARVQAMAAPLLGG